MRKRKRGVLKKNRKIYITRKENKFAYIIYIH